MEMLPYRRRRHKRVNDVWVGLCITAITNVITVRKPMFHSAFSTETLGRCQHRLEMSLGLNYNHHSPLPQSVSTSQSNRSPIPAFRTVFQSFKNVPTVNILISPPWLHGLIISLALIANDAGNL